VGLAARVLIGGLLGALIAYTAVPVLRFALLHGVGYAPDAQIARTSLLRPQNQPTLGPPTTLAEVGNWAEALAQRLINGPSLTPDDLITNAEIFQKASEEDPENAYWQVAIAVTQAALDNDDASKTAWVRAGELPRWDDHQGERIWPLVEAMEGAVGMPRSWHTTVVRGDRSAWLATYALESLAETMPRPSTVEIGLMIRDQSSTYQGAMVGRALIRYGIGEGRGDARTQRIMATNARIIRPAPYHRAEAGVLAGLPGALLAMTAASVTVCALLTLMRRFGRQELPLRLGVSALGFVAAGWAYGQLKLEWPAFVFASVGMASWILPALQPEESPKRLPAGWEWWVRGVSLALLMSVAWWFVSFAPAMQLMSPESLYEISPSPWQAAVWAALFIAILWALALIARFTTGRPLPWAVDQLAREAGMTFALAGLTLTVAALPACLALDRRVAHESQRALGQEVVSLPQTP